MTKKNRLSRVNKEPKDEVIDLIDIGLHNKTPVIRAKVDSGNESPIDFIVEDKGQAYQEPYTPPEPEYEDRLEAEGAFIINSTTYFPASNTTVTKKSHTPAEIAEERGYLHFNEV